MTLSRPLNKLRFVNGNFSLTFCGMSVYAALCLISMATMSIGAGIVGACILFDKGGPKRFWDELQTCFQSIWVKRYLWISLFLILSCVVSLCSARFYPLRFLGKTVTVDWMKDLAKMSYFIIPLILLVGWRRLSELQTTKVIQVWLISFGLFASFGLPQFFTGWPRAQENPILTGFFHPILFLGHHLSVASILIFPFFASLEFYGNSAQRKKLKLPSSFLIYLISIGLFVLIFSYSRTLWVALPLGIGCWILGRIPRKKASIALGALVLVGIALWQTPLVQNRIQNTMGISDRFELWKANWFFFQNRPIFGVGLLKNHELSAYYFPWRYPSQHDFFFGHAHNIYLEVLAGLGILGSIAWLLWVGWVFFALKAALKNRTSLNFAFGILCAWIVLMINGATQVNFWEGKVLHQMMWSIGLILFWVSGSAQSRSFNS